MFRRKLASKPIEVAPVVVSALNERMRKLESPYYFSRSERGYLTYFRQYEFARSSGRSVSRGEVERFLEVERKTTLASLVDEAFMWSAHAAPLAEA